LIAGASGLVGRELVRALSRHHEYAAVHSLVRRSSSSALPRVIEHVVDFEALPASPPCDDVFIALGTTIKAAGSEAAFRRVDHDYVLAVAKSARRAGASRLGIVSALGADPKSRVFYNRVKGEVEAALSHLGYDSVVIARPSLLLGDREALGQPARAGERWAERLLRPIAPLIPASYRPVAAADVAASLLAAVLSAPASVSVVSSASMHGSAARAS
jgi:uncharacterized protein YbjT (DUF2867 family)